jgi:hypothetical protein
MQFDSGAEFDRQVKNLLDRGYPDLAGMASNAFADLVAPLKRTVIGRGRMDSPSPGRVPFVLVVKRDLAPAEESMPLTTLQGKSKPGFIDRNFVPGELTTFTPIKHVEIPGGNAYVVFDVERGEEFGNVPPDDAMVKIAGRERTPITIDEGIALITHSPESLERNKCFSLLGSRCGDKRVPALWISQGAPKLGWCWAGNPHTWLGTASCGARAGMEPANSS